MADNRLEVLPNQEEEKKEDLPDFEFPDDIKEEYLESLKNKTQGRRNLEKWEREISSAINFEEETLGRKLTDAEYSILTHKFIEKRSPTMSAVMNRPTSEVENALVKTEKFSDQTDKKHGSKLAETIDEKDDTRKNYPIKKKFFNQKGNWVEILNYDEKTGDIKTRYWTEEDDETLETLSVNKFKDRFAEYTLPYHPEKIRKINMARAGSEHTLHKIKDYGEIVSEEDKENIVRDESGKIIKMKVTEGDKGKEGSDKVFIEKTRELWKKFAVHGYIGFDQNGKPEFKHETDLDGKGFLEVLKIAGFDISDLKFIKPGKVRKGAFTGDSGGGVDGVRYININGEDILVADHHPKEGRGADNSATKLAYEMLVEMGLIEKQKHLDKFVAFITDEDNKSYYNSDLKTLFDPNTKGYSKTLIGLQNYLDTGAMLEILKKDYGHLTPIDAKDLKKIKGIDPKSKEEKPLSSFGSKIRGLMTQSEEMIEKTLKNKNFIIDSGSKNFGRIVIDTGTLTENGFFINKISLGQDAVKGLGYDTLVVYIPEQKRFQIFTSKPMEFEKDIPQGESIGKFYWTKRGTDEKELTVTIEDILGKLGVTDPGAIKKLQDSLEKEQKERGIIWEKLEKIKKASEEMIGLLNIKEDDYSKKALKEASDLSQSVMQLSKERIGKKFTFATIGEKVEAIEKKKKEVEEFLKKIEIEKKTEEKDRSDQENKEVSSEREKETERFERIARVFRDRILEESDWSDFPGEEKEKKLKQLVIEKVEGIINDFGEHIKKEEASKIAEEIYNSI